MIRRDQFAAPQAAAKIVDPGVRRQPRRGSSLSWADRWIRAAIGVWQNHPDLTLILLLTLTAAAPRAFVQANAPTFVFTDSPGYVEPAVDLVHGEGLTTRLKQPIGYPLLVAAGLSGAGQLSSVTALQHSLGIMTVALTYLPAPTAQLVWSPVWPWHSPPCS